MAETQDTISRWAEETFGPSSSNARVAARANEEMAELIRALSAEDNNPKAAEEIADVLIALYRLNARMGFPYDNYGVFVGVAPNNLATATAINIQMAELLHVLSKDDNNARAKELIRLVYTGLLILADRMGFNLYEEVNKKMAVNRAREWRLDSTGHGYHVRDKSAA